MGLLDNVLENNAFQLGMNILGNNRYGDNYGLALGGGLQDFQRQKSLQAQQNRANALARQRDAQIKIQQQQHEQQQAQYQAGLKQQQAQQEAMQKNYPNLVNLPKHIQTAKLAQMYPKQSTYGTTPHFTEEGDAFQLSSSGGARKINAPLQKPLYQMNVGGQQFGLNPITNQPQGPVYQNTPKPSEMPRFKEKQAAATKRGSMLAEGESQAKIDLPQTTANANYTLDLISKAKTHPGRKAGTGLSSMVPSRPGGDAYSFDVLMKQIKGKQFLTAFEQLKGAGQITEIEGQKATEAEARMDQAQNEEDFLEALGEYEAVIKSLVSRAKSKANVNADGPMEGWKWDK